MKTSDIINSIIIIIVFAVINVIAVVGMGIDHIKRNWSEYKCMPMITPLSGLFGHSASKTFTECLSGTAKGFSNELMKPVDKGLHNLSNVGGDIAKFMINAASLGNSYQNSLLSGSGNLIEVGKLATMGMLTVLVKIFDMFKKMLAVFVTFIYLMLGLKITTESIWAGLPGQIVKGITGAK